MNWLDQLIPIAGITACLWVAWTLIKSLMRHDDHPQAAKLHLVAFCTHCGWEGRVTRNRMVCGRCGLSRLSVVAT
jgi:hypothetical protein